MHITPMLFCCAAAVLWLLLLSGSALKWAGLTPSAQHLFAVAQVFLSSGVVVAGIAAVIFSTAWGSLQCQVPACFTELLQLSISNSCSLACGSQARLKQNLQTLLPEQQIGTGGDCMSA